MLGPGGVLGFFYPEHGRISGRVPRLRRVYLKTTHKFHSYPELWLRFATLWLAVVVVGFAVSFYVLPYGLIWFMSALLFSS